MIIDTRKATDPIVSTALVTKLVASTYAHRKMDQVRNAKSRRTEKKYNKQIAASQAKIGPYKPATIPVQVWA